MRPVPGRRRGFNECIDHTFRVAAGALEASARGGVWRTLRMPARSPPRIDATSVYASPRGLAAADRCSHAPIVVVASQPGLRRLVRTPLRRNRRPDDQREHSWLKRRCWSMQLALLEGCCFLPDAEGCQCWRWTRPVVSRSISNAPIDESQLPHGWSRQPPVARSLVGEHRLPAPRRPPRCSGTAACGNSRIARRRRQVVDRRPFPPFVRRSTESRHRAPRRAPARRVRGLDPAE